MTDSADSSVTANSAPSEATPSTPSSSQPTGLKPIEATLAERGSRYGKYEHVADVSQQLKHVIYSNCVGSMYHYQAESLDMICNKIARIVCGDSNYADSWHDIAGYATLVVDTCSKENDNG
jgi:hypothetical protein